MPTYYQTVIRSQYRLVIYLLVNQNQPMDDKETLHRRARFRELLSACFADSQGALLNHITANGFKPNQGELSALKKDHGPKSFGDKKAKTLAEQIGLHRRWFDMPLGTWLSPSEWKGSEPLLQSADAEGQTLNTIRIHEDKPKKSHVLDIEDAIKDLESLPAQELREARLFIKKLVDIVRAKESLADRSSQGKKRHTSGD